MAAANFDQKKKLSHNVDRVPRDRAIGMNESTKQHFEEVKHKMLAFVNEQHREEFSNRQSPSLSTSSSPSFHHSPSPVFFDKKKLPIHRHHLLRPKPAPGHRQLPHLALATPPRARRMGRS